MLLVLLITEILVVVGVTSWLWYRNGQRAVTEVQAYLQEEISARIEQRVLQFLALPDRINQINEDAYHLGRLDLEHTASHEEYLRRQLMAFPSISYIDIGTENDDFIGVERLADGTIQLELRSEATGGDLHSYPLDDTGKRLTKKVSPAYIPTNRPWYQAAINADGPTWSAIYPFFSVPSRLGLAAVRPLKDDLGRTVGVLGCDLVLTHLSQFLGDLEVGKTGLTYIVERDGALLASSTSLEPLLRSGEEVLRVQVRDLGHPLIRASAEFIEERFGSFAEIENRQQAEFRAAGESNLIQISPLRDPIGINWLVVVVIPKADFMGSIRESTQTTLLLFLALLIVSTITILFTTRQITRSIEEVSRDMNRIADFNLNERPNAISTLTEIQVMQTSMEAMKTALRSFGKYVPSDVVRHLVRRKKEARLELEPANLTIFFSDVVGFTAIAEKLPPDELVELMSEYLAELSHIILESEGTVDKYIGDAIMAFWNAPNSVPDHPARAVGVALKCSASLQQMNAGWRKSGKPELRTRIGIHTGDVLVGNFGSPRRMNYTVLGDAVNLAARLEALNKEYGTEIIVSEETFAQVNKLFLCRPLDMVVVAGRRTPTTIYEVVAPLSEASRAEREFVAKYSCALDAYLARRFQEAGQIFESALKRKPEEVSCVLLAERCRRFEKTPPEPDWNGATTLSKA